MDRPHFELGHVISLEEGEANRSPGLSGRVVLLSVRPAGWRRAEPMAAPPGQAAFPSTHSVSWRGMAPHYCSGAAAIRKQRARPGRILESPLFGTRVYERESTPSPTSRESEDVPASRGRKKDPAEFRANSAGVR